MLWGKCEWSFRILWFVFLGALIHQCDTIFSKEQVEVITDVLLQIFCGKHMQVSLHEGM